MAKLISQASKVIERMERDGKVQTLSFHQSASIDHKIATDFKKVKSEFEIKDKNSRAYVAQIELASFKR